MRVNLRIPLSVITAVEDAGKILPQTLIKRMQPMPSKRGFQFLSIPGTDGIHLICRKHASFEEVHSAKILEAVGMKIGIIDFQPAFQVSRVAALITCVVDGKDAAPFPETGIGFSYLL